MDLDLLLRRQRRVRIIGVDDSPFERGRKRAVLVVGAVYSGDAFEGLLSTRIRQDGHNATSRLKTMINTSKFKRQLHLGMLDGITLGGFNVVDLPDLARETGLPWIAVMRRRPDFAAIREALEKLPRARQRWRLMRSAGPLHRAGTLWFQAAGLDPDLAAGLILNAVVRGHMPECLRAAHLIGGGVVIGESGRRA